MNEASGGATASRGGGTNFSAFVRSRLVALDYGQNDLARAARVTDSYVSQLLTRRKSPPAPERTDIYGKMEVLLQLSPESSSVWSRSSEPPRSSASWPKRPSRCFAGFVPCCSASVFRSAALKSAPSSNESRSASWNGWSRDRC